VAKAGRKQFLDEYKRREVLAILSVGGARRAAARYVGCTVNTIRSTADRDPEFAKKLRRAERGLEIDYLNNIRKAARNEKYWRAAAWALERIDPQRYARRSPDAITVEEIKDLLVQLADIISEEVPEEYREKILKRLRAISDRLKEG